MRFLLGCLVHALLYTHNPYSSLRRMLLHVLIEGHGFFYYLLVYLRGIEHVQSVFMPYCYAYVRSIESGFGCGDSYNVAIVDGRTEQFGIGY